MFWISFAKRAAKVLGRSNNVYSDKERKAYGAYIHNAQLGTTLGEFSAGAMLALLLGLCIGLLLALTFVFYIGFPVFPVALLAPLLLGVVMFFFFRRAPYYAYRAAVADMERALIQFIPFLQGCSSSGIPLEQILEEGSLGRFGHLSREFGKIMSRNVYLKNLTKAMTSSVAEIGKDSPFYKRVMTHVIKAREMGVEMVPGLKPEEQPLANAMRILADSETRAFGRRCKTYSHKIEPIMDFATIICVVFPVMMIILTIVSGLSGRMMMSLGMLKTMCAFMFPAITFMLVAMLAKWEPR